MADLKSPGIFHRSVSFLAVFVFLFALTYLAHFSQSRNIGFFSDDQTFAVEPLNWSPTVYRQWLHFEMMQYPEPQGRPLGFMLGVSLAYFGDRMAGMDGMFLIGWWVLAINAVLFYGLLKRCFSNAIPMLAAIGYVLFPADTTRPFLCHAHILQPSLTFMLIASHLALRGSIQTGRFVKSIGLLKQIAAYFVLGLCLITYETAVLPFLALPLLETSRDRRWWRRSAIHVAAVILLMGFVGLTRKLGHEYRADQISASKITVMLELIGGLFIGPATAFASYFWRMWLAIHYLIEQPTQLLALLAAGAVFFLVLFLNRESLSTTEDSAKYRTELSRAFQFGLASLILSYLLSFTHFPPFWIRGQLTSVHTAAVVGGSTLFAAFGNWLQLRRSRYPANLFLSVFLALLFIWTQDVQDNFVSLWHERQQFWTRIVDICPDMTDSTLIICDRKLPQPSKMMYLNCWSDSVVLRQMFQFPTTFKLAPEVACFLPDESGEGWRSFLSRDTQGKAIWVQSPFLRKPGAELVEGNTILLHMDDRGNLTRAAGSVSVIGKPFKLKDPVRRGLPDFPHLRLFAILTTAGRG